MKSWYQSKTIWGVVLLFVSQFLPNGITSHEISTVIESVTQAVGLVLALYGRLKATQTIKTGSDDNSDDNHSDALPA